LDGGFLAAFFTTEIGFSAVAARLVVASLLGAVLGFDREMLSRPAGIRTHMLVSLAASTFTVITFELIERGQAEGAPNADPIRVIEAVTAGVAFLAAGAIIQGRGKIHGVTTGAGLWLAGAIGTACGIGAFAIALLATVLGFLVLTLLRFATDTIPKEAPPPAASRADGKKSDGD
jgi:putative Mg2+ transporter-C (MgtC) family protein